MKTIQDLILDVQERISLPLDDDDRWSTAALVRTFNNALDDKLTPDLVSEGSNYLVHRDVVPLKINGISAYPLNSIPLPIRAVGRALREVKYLPVGKTKSDEELNCPAISLEEKDMFSDSNDLFTNEAPYVFIENDSLRLIGGNLDGSIVFYYSLEPSTIENVIGKYGLITTWGVSSISASSGSSQWDSFLPSGNTKLVDIYRKSTGSIIKANVNLARSGTIYTITGLNTSEIQQLQSYQFGNVPGVGFSVSTDNAELMFVPAGKCEFATIPYEFDQLLVLYVCERVLESLGDTEGLQVIMAKIKETRESISRITGNRLQGERKKLTDRRSLARIQRGYRSTRNYNKTYT